MDAPTRVLTTLNHEEPDRVPAFESAFTNNTIMAHSGVPVTGGLSGAARFVTYLPGKNWIANKAISNRNFLVKSMVDSYEFLRRVKIDIGISIVTHQQRTLTKGGMIDDSPRELLEDPIERKGDWPVFETVR